MLWKKPSENVPVARMTVLETLQRDAEELEDVLGWMCKNRCNRYEAVQSSYAMTEGDCEKCKLNRYICTHKAELGLLEGVEV